MFSFTNDTLTGHKKLKRYKLIVRNDATYDEAILFCHSTIHCNDCPFLPDNKCVVHYYEEKR